MTGSDEPELSSFEGTRAVSEGLTLICELADARRFGVPKNLIHTSSTVREAGDTGVLVIPTRLAETLGILAARAAESAQQRKLRAIRAHDRATVHQQRATDANARADTLRRREVKKPRHPH